MVYLWTVINPNDADRVTTVLDLKGVTLATATKADTIVFIKQCVTMMSTHYPEVCWMDAEFPEREPACLDTFVCCTHPGVLAGNVRILIVRRLRNALRRSEPMSHVYATLSRKPALLGSCYGRRCRLGVVDQ